MTPYLDEAQLEIATVDYFRELARIIHEGMELGCQGRL